jgi:formylglycine-generating enzyme required for sulfatase activity
VITFNKIEIPFRWCPPGKFKMGSPESEEDRFDNENQVDVTLTKGFWMMETEVTQELYQAVIGQNPSHFKGSRKLPVDKVSWYDAQTFIQKLNETNAVVNQLSGFRFTLPTEAQWEYACRAGTTTATAFGDSLSSEQANFDGNYPYNGAAKGLYLGKTIPVSSYPPNSWGLYDMHGNVYEWVSDWYVKTLTGGADLSGPAETSYRVLRGGSWHFIGRLCRSAYRFGSNPANRHKFNGFRFAIIWF